MRSTRTLCVVLVLAGSGCQGSISTQLTASAGLASSAAGSIAAGSSSTGTSASSSGTTGGTSSGSGTTGTSAGSSTGRPPPPVYVDGGYVRCELSVLTDGGTEALTWECRPGTYFCATDGTMTCAECLSDSDCANDDLPTFDPMRPHCDVSSGVGGYQGFCQQCLISDNCTGNPAGPYCDLNPSDWEPPIWTTGFETCAPLPLGCPFGTSPALGGCAVNHCSVDADCINALTPSQQLEPYCVQGSCADTETGNACPDCQCYYSSGVCGFPGVTALSCVGGRCDCTDQMQCGGAWPVCELLPGGEDGGTCGCSDDVQCGDAGLRCLTYPPTSSTFGGTACAVPCDTPGFPACSLWSTTSPVCDHSSGLCEPCGSDNDCQTKAGGPTDGPFCRPDGVCGCAKDDDCPEGQRCQDINERSMAGGLLGICGLPPPPCTPRSCFSNRCDLDSGACVSGCLTDEDCWNNSNGRVCFADSGSCGWCQDDSDCVKLGFAASGESYCDVSELTCMFGCASDLDCVGDVGRPHCIAPGPTSRCGCGGDADCAGNPNGAHCDTIPDDEGIGYCFCLDASDCPASEVCSAAPGQAATCSSSCQFSDGGCPPNFFCDPNSVCRPRCDPGHSCQAPYPICDLDDVAGQNVGQYDDGGEVDGGSGDGGSENQVVWCYECLSTSDCPQDLVCEHYGFACGPCYESQDCPPNEVCLTDFDDACRALCDGGACPAGEACDVNDLTLRGTDICYQCLSPSDCPDGLGCNARSHTCGTCTGPDAENLKDGCVPPYESCSDCPPDAVCSNYWFQNIDTSEVPNGVCLQNCDYVPCPEGKTCAVLPDFTPDHAYCFGCLTDADCADAGPGARCDTVLLTFTCQPPAT